MPREGERVAGYRLEAPLDGAGDRWRAVDTGSGSTVVVRRVRPGRPGPGDGGQAARRQVLREARAAAGLRHPAVVAVLDVVEHGGEVWVVEEDVAAPNLAGAGPLGPADVARIGFDLADALDAAGDAGIVHGDITPAAVLVGPEGAMLSGLGTRWPGPGGSAPEVAAGAEPTAASDVYGLGATLRAALPPDSGSSALDGVLDALLDPDPARRPAAGRARDMLAAVAAGRPVPGAAAPPTARRAVDTADDPDAARRRPGGAAADAEASPRGGPPVRLVVGALVVLAVLLVIVLVVRGA